MDSGNRIIREPALTLNIRFGAADEGVSFEALIAAAVSGMGNHCAAGIVSTNIGARALALLLDAGLVSRTLATQRTLRPAIGRAANVVGHTGAHWAVLLDLANGVGSTGGWHTWVLWQIDFASRIRNGRACHEGISLEFRFTRANGVVVEHLAAGSTATDSGTGIGAALIETSLVGGTLRADHALWLANGRSALEVRQAGAGSKAIGSGAATGVGSTRGRFTGMRHWGQVVRIAGNGGVSTVPLVANTNRGMVDHPAHGIDAANSGTGLHALGVQTGLLRRTVAVEHALRPAANVRISEVSLPADAGEATVLALALSIGSALELGAAGLRWRDNH